MQIQLVTSQLEVRDVSAPDVVGIRLTLPSGLVLEIDQSGDKVSVSRANGRVLVIEPVSTNAVRVAAGEG